ncbi:MAG TPA: hypothetical protein DEP72_05960 [Clostridiales bacterium]|nr:MAG: hypothetical protein A2Y18_08425 [Clostridiales bacterium GWD2_32_19]HCC07683.1 hypothetical protein [Clostridiales bacterium]
MKKKKSVKKVWKLILVVMIIGVAAYLLNETLVEKTQVTVYCVDKTETKLVSENRNIKYKDTEDLMKKVADELKKDPKDKSVIKLIPENVEIENILYNQKDKVVEISLSKDFNDLSSKEKIFMTSGIAKTFNQFDFVEGVKFFVGEEPMKNENGEEIGVITENDVITDTTQQAQEKKEVEIKLYFTNEDASSLIRETRKTIISSDEKTEKVLIEELISGPGIDGKLISPIPKGTELKDIEVKDGICYVDFNEAFKTNHVGGSDLERLTIFSIVNSLTEIEEINKVQFLIEGKKSEIYKGHYEFDKPFERDDSIIKK